jgi:Protein of unknown function (DUF2971)
MIEEHQCNGFSYKLDYSKKRLEGFDIIHNKSKPESVYKYYSISNYSVDAILNGYFYASHPLELNDHMDSSNFLWGAAKPIDFVMYERLLGEVYKPEELKWFYEKDSVSNEGFYSQEFIAKLWQIMSNIFGVISLTSQDKSNLMWPHYTQEKGIQIKFNTLALEMSMNNNIKEDEDCLGLYPMNYCKRLNPIDMSDFKSYHVPFLYLTNIKSEPWEYEDEWRFIIGKHNMGVPFSKSGLDPREDYEVNKENRRAFYDKSIVDEITLGNNFFTGREFTIDRSLEKGFTVEPIKSDANWNYKSHVKILNYIEVNLKDKLFYSGKTFKIDEDGSPFLVRTKERMEIENLSGNKYLLTRTNEFY